MSYSVWCIYEFFYCKWKLKIKYIAETEVWISKLLNKSILQTGFSIIQVQYEKRLRVRTFLCTHACVRIPKSPSLPTIITRNVVYYYKIVFQWLYHFFDRAFCLLCDYLYNNPFIIPVLFAIVHIVVMLFYLFCTLF